MDKSYTTPQPVGATGGAKFGYFILIILTLGIFWLVMIIGRKNKIRRMGMKVDESESGIDVQLAKRADTLTKLMDTVKSSIKFETDILTKVTELRSRATSGSNDITAKSQINSELQAVERKVGLAIEAYPDLKSNENILQLQNSIKDVEDNIAASRRIYNSNVTTYNSQIITFPTNVVAAKMGLQTKVLFVATEQQKLDVKIDLGI
ncbi:LemA family protein [Spiroplasma endosymbiont of Othius punctulatus]|uniref:LemA family protein n=1 Tax=Spiroplasma endosymbiont of Othius punctulatus TaxID=3066289 RepID=UPI0030D5B55F